MITLQDKIYDILVDERNWERGYGGDCLKTHACAEQIEALLAPSNLPESANISSELVEDTEKLEKKQAPVEGEEGYGLYMYLKRQSTMTDYSCPCGHKWQMEGIQDIPCPKCNPPSKQGGIESVVTYLDAVRRAELMMRDSARKENNQSIYMMHSDRAQVVIEIITYIKKEFSL
jgi:hypothetical protein